MEINQKLEILAEILETKASDIAPDDNLDKFSSWDSMAALSLIVALEENFGRSDIDGKMIKSFVFVQDILNVMEK